MAVDEVYNSAAGGNDGKIIFKVFARLENGSNNSYRNSKVNATVADTSNDRKRLSHTKFGAYLFIVYHNLCGNFSFFVAVNIRKLSSRFVALYYEYRRFT